ncbi:hypothetical protein [Rhodopirellula halodulae]|nr:hypothetical protein [Rhodopirellula sp. JC740]
MPDFSGLAATICRESVRRGDQTGDSSGESAHPRRNAPPAAVDLL